MLLSAPFEDKCRGGGFLHFISPGEVGERIADRRKKERKKEQETGRGRRLQTWAT